MSDQTATPNHPIAAAPAQGLSERLASLAPSPGASAFSGTDSPPLPRPSPAVAAALATSQARAAEAARRAERPPSRRSLLGRAIGGFVIACASVPYAIVALGLRLVIARVFFLSGQSKVDGIRFPFTVSDFDFSVILPMQVKAETVSAFMSKYSALPLSPVPAAYLVSAAEFVLPLCLVFGFATRFAALGLMAMAVIIQLYAAPEALWTAHVYWFAILAVLLTRGAGEISLDWLIRALARR